jgi:hypothetical protein
MDAEQFPYPFAPDANLFHVRRNKVLSGPHASQNFIILLQPSLFRAGKNIFDDSGQHELSRILSNTT